MGQSGDGRSDRDRVDELYVAKLDGSIYLGEDGSPDGLNLGNLGGRQESLDLLGL